MIKIKKKKRKNDDELIVVILATLIMFVMLVMLIVMTRSLFVAEKVEPKYGEETELVGLSTIDFASISTPAPTQKATPKPKPTSVPKINTSIKRKKKVQNRISMGEFLITAYCPCYGCSEGYGRTTSTGHRATSSRTIAVDPRVIPYGSKVYIKGLGEFVAEDCGGDVKGNHIDIFFDYHSITDEFGRKFRKVYIIK